MIRLFRRCLLLLIVLSAGRPAAGQPFASFEAFTAALQGAATAYAPDGAAASLDSLWAWLLAEDHVPYVQGDSAAFLWRGAADDVRWTGDFNGWHPDGISGRRLGESDVWIRTMGFPADARIDYKIIVDGTWSLDPSNPLRQLSGFGPNSELRMPEYIPPREAVRRPDVSAGRLSPALHLDSERLGYTVQYRVYTPAGYDGERPLPVVYTTDGHEYAHDEMGSMVIVLDNLIADGSMAPVIAVFVDPRDVANPSLNRRADEFLMNPAHLAFFTDELVPEIDAAYVTAAAPDTRAILGTSFGGVNAAYFGVSAPDVFRLVGIQSPAFSSARELIDLYRRADLPRSYIFMSTGTIGDGEDMTREMRSVFVRSGFRHRYVEVNEGHSWGNWRALLDDMFTYFFPPSATGAAHMPTPQNGGVALRHGPNPVADRTTFTFDLAQSGSVTMELYDMLGQRVLVPVDGATFSRGSHSVVVGTADLVAGVYVARIASEGGTASRLVVRAP